MNELKDLLESYKLGSLVDTFFNEGIDDIDTLMKLAGLDEEIKTLAPRIGDKIKLRALIKDLTENPSVASTFGQSKSTRVSSVVQTPTMRDSTAFKVPDKVPTPPAPTFKQLVMDIPSLIDDTEESSTTQYQVGIAEAMATSSKRPNEFMPSTSGSDSDNFRPSKKTKLLPAVFSRSEVLQYLEESGRGIAVMAYYNKNKELPPAYQDIIVQIIMDRIVLSANCTMKGNIMQNLADIIISIFPTEPAHVYYSDRMTPKKKIACGKLYCKYVNMKNLLRKCCTDNDKISVSEPYSITKCEYQSDDILWLQQNSEPWEEVLRRWRSSFQSRITSMTAQQDISSLINAWPLYKHAHGHVLVRIEYIMDI